MTYSVSPEHTSFSRTSISGTFIPGTSISVYLFICLRTKGSVVVETTAGYGAMHYTPTAGAQLKRGGDGELAVAVAAQTGTVFHAPL